MNRSAPRSLKYERTERTPGCINTLGELVDALVLQS
jgi:hypothetical protein